NLLRRVAQDCKSLPRRFVEEAVRDLDKAITKKLRADTGGDRSLSGAPGRLRVQKKISGETVVTGEVTPGPRSRMAQWSWLEYGTGHPGPTKPKDTWSEPASHEIEVLRRKARQRL